MFPEDIAAALLINLARLMLAMGYVVWMLRRISYGQSLIWWPLLLIVAIGFALSFVQTPLADWLYRQFTP